MRRKGQEAEPAARRKKNVDELPSRPSVNTCPCASMNRNAIQLACDGVIVDGRIAMTERRHEFRLETLGSAKIILANGEAPIRCILHDISGSGGCLEVSELVQLPETFRLVPDDGEPLGYSCRMVWRKESRVGITFDD
jgi:hypothetical protein